MKEEKAYIGDEIVEGNKRICEFMGGKKFKVVWFYVGPDGFEHESGTHLKYHSSWDWLLPCFKKFNEMVQAEEIKHDYQSSAIHDCLEISIIKVNISDAHKYFSQLILWHNNQNKQS